MNPITMRLGFLLISLGFSGPSLCDNTPLHLNAKGTIELAFTPEHNAQGVILRAIDGARRQIAVQGYSFTSRDIAEALIRAHQRGVRVQVILDTDQALRLSGSQLDTLAAAAIPLWLDGYHRAAHSKIILIDPSDPQGAVLTGSYNFSNAAQQSNSENLLLLRGNPTLNRAYFEHWQRHLAHSLPYPPNSPFSTLTQPDGH